MLGEDRVDARALVTAHLAELEADLDQVVRDDRARQAEVEGRDRAELAEDRAASTLQPRGSEF